MRQIQPQQMPPRMPAAQIDQRAVEQRMGGKTCLLTPPRRAIAARPFEPGPDRRIDPRLRLTRIIGKGVRCGGRFMP
jgi:hypothetical protein